MKTLNRIAAATVVVFACASFVRAEVKDDAIGKQIPAFKTKILTLKGDQVTEKDFDSTTSGKPTVYGIVGTTCPSTAAYSERIKALAAKYESKGARVLLVYPTSSETRETKIAYHKEKGFAAGLIDDQGGAIARSLGATRTTEMFLADAKGKIVFHGSIDDSKEDPAKVKTAYLAQAIDETLAGKPVTVPTSQVYA